MSPQLMSRIEIAPMDVASNGETPGYWRSPDPRWVRGGSAAVRVRVTYLDRPAGAVDGVLQRGERVQSSAGGVTHDQPRPGAPS